MNDLISQMANEAQHKASDPVICAWVSASAGSGKTKVLTDRLLRLLLSKVEPEKILCLTFTKTAAAEMSNRLSAILQKWSVCSNEQLLSSLKKLLGNDFKEETLTTARQLFARVLDVRGGLNIMTIHSFCQKLLKRFPLEANLSPAFEVIDDSSEKIYLKQSFNRIILSKTFEKDFEVLSEFFSEKKLLETLFDSQSEYRRLSSLLDRNQSIDSLFLKLSDTLEINPTDTIESLIAPYKNLEDWNEYKLHYLTREDDIRRKLPLEDIPKAREVLRTLDKIKSLKTLTFTKSFIRIFMATLNEYQNFKEQKDFLDYDDLIIKTENMLQEANMSNWVLYKLDGGLEHILVDEAQDTNPHQWEIIRMIAQEFFSGEGEKNSKQTIFAVGDRKQSIYSFQGADPDCFEKMRIFFKQKISESKNRFEDIPFNISFRSTKPILDLVNYFIQTQPAGLLVGHEKPEDLIHTAYRQGVGGLVEIWPIEEGEEKAKKSFEWDLPTIVENTKKASLKLVQKIVCRIQEMLDNKEILKSENRPIEAGDIMILLRRRGNLMNELVKALKEQNIPVAGVDRLILTQHIAIMDLISLAEFLLLPQNDLKLAEVLKSPLFNLSETDLFQLAFNRKATLFQSVKEQKPEVAERLSKLLNLSDNFHPFELFSYVLNNGGRKAFLERLGIETNEMLDEFLNLCLTFEKENTPSLQSFVNWIKEDDIEIKRDLEQAHQNAVRIMTVHGSKGLESKIVFLPDTCSIPKNIGKIIWTDGLPFLLTKKDYHPEKIRNAVIHEQNKLLLEYNRLLYVAITRATDRLYIGGFAGKSVPGSCWYKMLESSLPPGVKLIESEQTTPVPERERQTSKKVILKEIPDWYFRNPPIETTEKTLSPSKMGQEDEFEPSPLSEDQEMALRRGSFIHKLLQVLPDIPEDQREIFIQKTKPKDIDIPENLLEIFRREEFKHLFGKDSMAEVPIVGQIDGAPVSGQIDRLVVLEDEVLLIDFKTNRYVPVDLEAVPLVYKEQLKAYKDLLKNIFSDKKRIRCFLFWTTNLKLMEL